MTAWDLLFALALAAALTLAFRDLVRGLGEVLPEDREGRR